MNLKIIQKYKVFFRILIVVLIFSLIIGCISDYTDSVRSCESNNITVAADIQSNGSYMKDTLNSGINYHATFTAHNFEEYKLQNVTIDFSLCTNGRLTQMACFNDSSFYIGDLLPNETKVVTYNFEYPSNLVQNFNLIRSSHSESPRCKNS